MTKKSKESIRFDSAYFVAFDLMHSALKSGLKTVSDLSITQYRILVRLLSFSPQSLGQSDIGKFLHLKPNVVTQSLSVLENKNFVQRMHADEDGRTRTACITDVGIAHISEVNESIVRELYARFPTEDKTFRHILEASIAAGSAIDSPSPGKATQQFPASRTLAAFELISETMEESLREACGATLSECRIMQRLEEEGAPLRIGDLAERLHLSAVSVARTTDRLVQRGWVERMGIPHDKKAVFVVPTEEGVQQQVVIIDTIESLAQSLLWSKLNATHRKAIKEVGTIVFADIQAKKEAEHKAMLSLLQPL